MMRRPRRCALPIRPLLLTLAVLPVGACGKPPVTRGSPLHPVAGRVTIGGRPAAGVQVRLHPLNRALDPDAPRPEGITDGDGRFRLRTGGVRDGAPAGPYVVTLVWPVAGGADRLGGSFAEPDGSGITAIVEETTEELPPFAIDAVAVRRGNAR